MKRFITPMLFFLAVFYNAGAQEIITVSYKNSVKHFKAEKINAVHFPESALYEGYYYLFLHFDRLPERSVWKKSRIRPVHFIPENNYFCAIPQNFQPQELIQLGVSAYWAWEDEMKISEAAAGEILNNETEEVELFVQIVKTIDAQRLRNLLAKYRIRVMDDSKEPYGLWTVKVARGRVNKLLRIPVITWLEPLPPAPEAIRYRAIGTERVAPLHNRFGEHLRGEGMVIGVGDNGKIGTHIDFGSRVTTFSKYGTGTHATHVTGIITGYPNLNPREGIGTAPEAHVITSYFSDILDRTPDFIRDYGMLITNNSYGISGGNCTNAGDYSLLAVFIDEQQEQYDSLIHVFAAGNNGSWTCSPYPSHYATISNGWQCAKSTFTIGACNHQNSLAYYSSRGPTDDGRIKPEIVAVGNDVRSTRPNNSYSGGGGTSYSSPAMTGITALMYEKYKSQHGNHPPATLIKALLCNSADDKGLSGPDYYWGYGRVNAARAVADLDQSRYFNGNLGDGDSVEYTLTVPAGVDKLKVMVMWRDPAAAPYAAPVLVNDIDMTLTDPSSNSYDPWVLDPAPSKVNQAAVRDKDHLNPQEQITLNNPVAGDYTIRLHGHRIPFGPQEYFLVYSFQQNGITVRYPDGGESLVPGETEYIRWDAFGHGSETFTVELSKDGGSTWSTLAGGLSSATRSFTWVVSGASTQALIRVKTNSFSDVSDHTFGIIGLPANLTASTPCDGYIKLTWDAVDSAAYYGIYRLGADTMTLIDTTSALEYTRGKWTVGQTQWLSVNAIDTLDQRGRRAVAKQIIANGGATCPWPDDMAVSQMLTTDFSREHTLSDLGATTALSVVLLNAGNTEIDTFEVSYQINGGAIVTEATRDTIPVGDTIHYTFNQMESFTPGSYDIVFWSTLSSDTHPHNDTLRQTLRVVANDPVVLPYTEGFENADSIDIRADYPGIPGLDAWDYDIGTGAGRIRSFAGQGFIKDGSRAMTMDAYNYGSYSANNLLLTLNMTNYDTATDDIRLQFDYMHHEVTSVDNPNDRIWVRGADTSLWVELYNLFDHQGMRGVYNEVHSGLSITQALKDAGQNFTSSFQIRFGQEGNAAAVETTAEDGYTFDNIQLLNVSDDIALEEILHPGNTGCGLGVEKPKLRIHNNATTDAANVEVTYRINGGASVTESIPLITGETTLDYTFSTGYDFSALGTYHMDTWIHFGPDNFRDNDSILGYEIVHQPRIDSFPYVEGFEGNTDGWYTGGTLSSWELGTPAAGIIGHAAKGQKAWVTNLTGTYHNDEYSYLYSPCYDLSGMTTPMLSFAFIYQIENNYDYGWVEYSTDGKTWTKLGAQGQGVNWYNDATNAWDDTKNHWSVATIQIPVTDTTTMFRWVLQTDVGLTLEGMGIDQVSIYEHDTIYSGPNIDSMSVAVSGNDWVEVDSNGQRIVAVHPHGQDLGLAQVSMYQYNGIQRYDDNAYYAQRSFVIKTDSAPNNPVDVRLYFTDAEMESLRGAANCMKCISLDDAFQIEIKKYSATLEDSIPTNNDSGTTLWYPADSIEVVPFEDGYYAVITVDSFSELWITSPKLSYVDSTVVPIGQASDDAEEHKASGSVNPYSKTIELTRDVDDQIVGLRFDDIQIPQGSFIDRAWIQFRAADTNAQSNTLTIRIEDSDNTNTFNTGNYNISSRGVLSTSKTWYLPAWMVDNEASVNQRSPEVRHFIQQITDRAGWQPGNALSFILEGVGHHSAFAMDSVRDYSARLHIIYDSVCHYNQVIYVDASATGRQDGRSWGGAFRTLDEAFDLVERCPDAHEIWVKEGLYYPTDGTDRNATFDLPEGVTIYGGFAGTESLVSQRNYLMHQSILSGDIGMVGDSTDNVFHVITNTALVDSCTLDGLFIRHGTANGTNLGENTGGGILNSGLLILKNMDIRSCTATLHGANIENSGASTTLILENCTIHPGDVSDNSGVHNTNNAQIIIRGGITEMD